MKKILLILILSMFLISLVSAEDVSIGTVKQGDTIQLTQLCSNCTYVNITQVQFPNKSFAFQEQFWMNKSGENYNYTWSNTNTVGDYIYTTCGDYNTINTCQNVHFEVTYSGLNFGIGQAIIYIILFAMLLFTFFITLFGINQLPKYNQQDDEGRILSVTYLKYLRPVGWMFEYMLFVAMLYMTSNIAFAYLNEQLFAKILFMLFKVSFGFAPLIAVGWVAWIFVEMFHDKRFQDLLNRGFFPESKDY